MYLSVPALAASASVETTKQQYSQVFLLDFDSWIFEKNLRYKGFGVMQMGLTGSRFRALSGPAKGNSFVKDNWSV